MFSHAYEITDGDNRRELFTRLSGSWDSLGGVAVDGFFVLSGYFIVRSWVGDPEFFNFLRKRLLRILPGYVVAVFVGTLTVGLLAPAIPHFFHHLGWPFVRSVLRMDPETPPVLPGMHYQVINGSLWSLQHELRCYIYVAVLGVLGVFRRPVLVPLFALALTAAAVLPAIQHLPWNYYQELAFGFARVGYRLMAAFFVGSSFFLFRDRIRFRPQYALIAVAALIAVRLLAPHNILLALVFAGSYLMFYAAQMTLPFHPNLQGLPDISYGLYLYGYPIESLWIYFVHGSPLIAFAGSLCICTVFAWLSWHFVERPMLSLKRRATAQLQPA